MSNFINYIDELEYRWKNLFLDDADFYLYGVASNARRVLLMAEKTGVISKIKGCLVSNMKGNPAYCEGIPVMAANELENKKAIILLPHAGKQKKNIYNH